jgi:NDP-sugar pyrophosphorylase family protein
MKEHINTTFFVSNCDILIDQDYAEILKYHKESNNELTAVAAIKTYGIPYGTLEIGKDGLLKSLKEKPENTYYVNAGLYILEPQLLNEIPENEFFHITHLIEKIIQRNGRIGVFPVSEGAWMDIGDWNQYSETQQKFNNRFNF